MKTESLQKRLTVPAARMLPILLAMVVVPALAASGNFNKTGSMNVARDGQTATLLANGEVLVVGGMNDTNGFLASAEVYNPASGKWTFTGNLSVARFDHNAVLLSNGQVLVAGGLDPNACCGAPPLASAELFNPATGVWTPTGSMSTGRESFVLIALPNGQVLAAGGNGYPGLTSAELYNPTSGTWTTTGSTATGLEGSGAVLLQNGSVFAAGNHELYSPTMGEWSTITAPPTNRGTVNFDTLLPSGLVWIGENDLLFNPSTAQWTTFAQPSCISGNESCGGGAAMLANGQVLAAGGIVEVNAQPYPIPETIKTSVLWNPATLGWTSTGDLTVSRTGQTMTRLLSGQILVAGGETFDKNAGKLVPISGAELYTP